MPHPITYPLEQLYVDQDPDFVADTIPAVLVWVPGPRAAQDAQPHIFHLATQDSEPLTLALTWDLAALSRHDPKLAVRTQRLRAGRTVLAEKQAELAAYGLAFVAISVFLPGQRVRAMRLWAPGDLLLDTTPAALRGVEVAGRSSGGWGELHRLQREKTATLLACTELTEIHLSLWCAAPQTAIFLRVRP